MFWKIIAIVWTSLVLVVSVVHLVLTSQEAPSDEPWGTQATALLENVSAEQLAVAPSLIGADFLVKKVLLEGTPKRLSEDLRGKLEKDFSSFVSVRPFGAEGTTLLAIDVRWLQR